MEQKRKSPRLLAIAAAMIVVAALYLARDVLIPFALAIVITFLLAPAVSRLQRWGVPRALAVLAAVLVLLSCTGLVAWMVFAQARDLAHKLPEYRANIELKTAALREFVREPFEQASRTVSSLSEPIVPPAPAARAATVAAAPAPEVGNSLGELFAPLVSSATMAVLVLMFVILMLMYREDLRDRFIVLVGNGQVLVATQALDDAATRVSRYLSRQLLVNVLLGIAIASGLALVGVPDALLWGALLALLRFVPYIGVWIAATLPLLLTFATSESWLRPLEVLGVFVVLEFVAYGLIEPRLYGGGTGVSPLAILLSTLFWSWLWGPLGLVLATPMTVCLVVLGKYVPQASILYLLFNDQPALPAPARLYQRLLAHDQDEAWNLVSAELQQRSLEELDDELVIPALAMAERDRQQGDLDDAGVRRVCDSIQLLLDELPDPREAPRPESADTRERQEAPGASILCLGARSVVDFVAAGILARRLASTGAHTTLVPQSELMGETLERCLSRPVDVVLISAVPPSHFMHVRYICKRLAKQCPEVDIVVVMWTLDMQAAGHAERLPQGERVHVVASLAQARAKVHELGASLRVRNVQAASG